MKVTLRLPETCTLGGNVVRDFRKIPGKLKTTQFVLRDLKTHEPQFPTS